MSFIKLTTYNRNPESDIDDKFYESYYNVSNIISVDPITIIHSSVRKGKGAVIRTCDGALETVETVKEIMTRIAQVRS